MSCCPPTPSPERSRVQVSTWLMSCYHSCWLNLFCLFTKALATSFLILMPTKRGHSGLEMCSHGIWKPETSLTSENGQSTLFTSRWLPQTMLMTHSSLPIPLSTQSPTAGLPPPACASTWSKGLFCHKLHSLITQHDLSPQQRCRRQSHDNIKNE